MLSHNIMRSDTYQRENPETENNEPKSFLLLVNSNHTRISCKDAGNTLFREKEGNQCHCNLFNFPERRMGNNIYFSKVKVQLGYRRFRQKWEWRVIFSLSNTDGLPWTLGFYYNRGTGVYLYSLAKYLWSLYCSYLGWSFEWAFWDI